MADDDQSGLLGKAVSSIGEVLPYAIPAALGAALGGPMGALAGVASSEPRPVDPFKSAQLGIDEEKLGLQQEQIQQTKELKESQQQAQLDYREQTEQDKHDQMIARANEWSQNFLQRKDDHDALQQYRQGQQMLEQENQAIRAQMAQSISDDRRDRLQQNLDENTRARIAGYQTLAEHAAEKAPSMRSFWSKYVGDTRTMSDADVADAARDKTFTDSLKNSGISRDDLLNAGVSPDIVDKVYPTTKSLAGKKDTATAPAGLPKGYKLSTRTTKDGKPVYENPMAPAAKRYWSPD